jgi:hypothetical protein
VDGAGSDDDQKTVITLLDNLDGLVTAGADSLSGTGRLIEAIVSLMCASKYGESRRAGVQEKKKKKTHGGDLSLEELRRQQWVVSED